MHAPSSHRKDEVVKPKLERPTQPSQDLLGQALTAALIEFSVSYLQSHPTAQLPTLAVVVIIILIQRWHRMG